MCHARTWLPTSGLILFFAFASIAAELSITSLIANPEKFDGKSVTVQGAVAQLSQTVSHSGNAYSTFQVQDTGGAVKVFTWGHPGIKSGDQVRVTGVFQQVKRVRQYTFYNEIEAQSITPITR
jgi:hypothetical protein